MPATEIHHDKWGVLVSWGHACGHLSNPIRYESAAKAETRRFEMEARSCWECITRWQLFTGGAEGPPD